MLLALLDSLTRLVDGLSYGSTSSDWSTYSDGRCSSWSRSVPCSRAGMDSAGRIAV